MKVRTLTLNNFRRFDSAKFGFDPNFTVLIGVNGKGKTTLLDALSSMLGTYFQGAKIPVGRIAMRKTDARRILTEKGGQIFEEPESEVYIEACAEYEGGEINWLRKLGDRAGKAREMTDVGNSHRARHKNREDFTKPLFLYYGTGRLWNAHRKIETEKPGSQLDAYRFCLDPKSDQKAFEKWFKKLYLSKLQKGREIPALDSVRNAVKQCVPGCRDFFHDVELDEIIIDLSEEGLMPFNLLSDGYRNMVALVADIAHRASRLNPHLEGSAAKETDGVVLIDELDLHLHPIWQRQVVGDLKAAFPNIQFIATTHSPFILQSLEHGEVLDLSADPNPDRPLPEWMASPSPADEYSNRSIEDITEEIMGVPLPQRGERHQKMYETAKEYYTLLEQGKEADEGKKQEIKAELDELSAPFSDNVAYHAFLEMERMAAGLGKSQDGGQS